MIGAVELEFEEFGQANPEPLIILHGFFASSRNWRQISENLAARYHVYVPDMRNHGFSPHHPEMDYPSMTDDVFAFMDRQGIDSAHVMGHSMGGKIAMWLALHHPDRIKKLIVVDIAPKAYSHSFDGIISALAALPLSHIHNRKTAEQWLAQSIPELGYRQFLLQNLVVENGEYRWRIDLPVFQRNGDHIAGFPRVADIKPFQKPTLFVAGALSHYVEQSDVEALFHNSDYEVIDGAGHWVHSQKPAFFLEVVENFLQSE